MRGLFNDRKNFAYFTLQSRKFSGQHRSPRVQHHIDVSRQQLQVETYGFAHAPLDAVAVDRFADSPGNGDAEAGRAAISGRSCSRQAERGEKGARDAGTMIVHETEIGPAENPRVSWKRDLATGGCFS